MNKLILFALAAYFTGLAAVLLIVPGMFYETVPGVSISGAYNAHFMRDVGLAFLLSAAALYFGTLRKDRVIALFGAGFPLLHGVFHLLMWLKAGLPVNATALFDVGATSVLGLLTALTAANLKGAKV